MNIHYFSLSALDGEHLGFFVLHTYTEPHHHNAHGEFAIKVQETASEAHPDLLRFLHTFEQKQEPMFWQQKGEWAELSSDTGEVVGKLQREHLTLFPHTFILNDLTGLL